MIEYPVREGKYLGSKVFFCDGGAICTEWSLPLADDCKRWAPGLPATLYCRDGSGNGLM